MGKFKNQDGLRKQTGLPTIVPINKKSGDQRPQKKRGEIRKAKRVGTK